MAESKTNLEERERRRFDDLVVLQQQCTNQDYERTLVGGIHLAKLKGRLAAKETSLIEKKLAAEDAERRSPMAKQGSGRKSNSKLNSKPKPTSKPSLILIEVYMKPKNRYLNPYTNIVKTVIHTVSSSKQEITLGYVTLKAVAIQNESGSYGSGALARIRVSMRAKRPSWEKS